jgi:hypothetical protein
VAIGARITGWHGTTPPEATTATGTTINPDPPSITPSWGSEENLILCTCGQNGAGAGGNITVFPEADNQTQDGTGGGGSAGGGICTAEQSASPYNPGQFTLAASIDWVAATIVVRPGDSGINVDSGIDNLGAWAQGVKIWP